MTVLSKYLEEAVGVEPLEFEELETEVEKFTEEQGVDEKELETFSSSFSQIMELSKTLEQLGENVSLEGHTLVFLEKALASNSERLGLESTALTVTGGDDKTDTGEAKKTLSKKAKELWDGFIKWVKGVLAKIADFFTNVLGKLFNSVGSIKKKVEQLSAEAKELKGLEPKKEKIEFSKSSKITTNGKIDFDSINGSYKDFSNDIANFTNGLAEPLAEVYKTYLKKFGEVRKEHEGFERLAEQKKEVYEKFSKNVNESTLPGLLTLELKLPTGNIDNTRSFADLFPFLTVGKKEIKESELEKETATYTSLN